MSKTITEKEILMHNIHELQENLQNAYKKIATLHEQLERCLVQNEKKDDEISIVWSVEDVMQECDWLTREQALDVLYHLEHKHDACIGINWEVIHYNAQWMYPKENEDAVA